MRRASWSWTCCSGSGGTIAPGFSGLTPEQQAEFLQKQGFARFRDVLAHIIAWWEQGIAVIQAGSAEDPADVEDVDAFNAQAVARFADLEESQVLAQFEETRLTLANLVDMLPDEVLSTAQRPGLAAGGRAGSLLRARHLSDWRC